ncbi:hypothetical protein ACH5RR_002036 [Cinchona calisaya]|uniref:Mediator complex subunit 15 KIX domain-containing protein n=1 Tax=Cinchona calisaya TaxID=153742 RepID=A0ABD3B5Q3_9GENT
MSSSDKMDNLLAENESTMVSGDWRTRLRVDSRSRIITKIMKTLKRHLTVYGPELEGEIRKNAVRFEERIYATATREHEFSRGHLATSPLVFNGAGFSSSLSNKMDKLLGENESNMVSSDWRTQLRVDSRDKIITKMTKTLKRHLSDRG